MANSNRDAMGRWSSANIPDVPTAARPGAADAASFSASETPAARGAALGISDGSKDNWGGPSQTAALLNRPVGGTGGGGMGKSGGVGKPVKPDYYRGQEDLGLQTGDDPDKGDDKDNPGKNDQALRAGGYGGPETAGQHQVFVPGGRADHGAGVPGAGVPGPADPGGIPGTMPGSPPRRFGFGLPDAPDGTVPGGVGGTEASVVERGIAGL